MSIAKASLNRVLKMDSSHTSVRWAALAFIILVLTPGLSLAQGTGRQQLHGHVPATLSTAPQLESVPAGQTMDLAIGLPLRNQDELQSLLKDLYNPHSLQFRHFLTPDQFTARFGPTAADYQAVIDFAKAHHLQVTRTHSNRVLVHVRGAAGDIQKAFHVNLNNYKRGDGTKFYSLDREPSLDLDTPVLHVSGLENFHVAHSNSFKKSTLSKRGGKQTVGKNNKPVPNMGTATEGLYQGLDLRDAYCNGVPAGLNGSGQSVGLMEFDGFYQSDINYYASSSNPALAPITPTTVLIDGYDGTPGGGNFEVSLDIEMVMSLAPGAQIVAYEASSANYQVAADDLMAAMAEPPLCNQLSCSWYDFGDETDANFLAQYAAQGQSFFLAAGDYGAFGPGDYFGAMPPPGYISPYITEVGGTQLTTSIPAGSPVGLSYVSETTWNDDANGAGAGGILTNLLPIPSYQTSIAFTAYPPGNGGSTQWRNVPDVSIVADDLLVVAENFESGSGYDGGGAGTSAGAPLWAAYTSMVNQQASSNGLPSVGFLNPLLTNLGNGPNYNSDFHDIADGSNNDGQGRDSMAYTAVKGYDLATGWGSPNGSSLINDLVSGIPTTTPTPSGTWTTHTATSTPTNSFTPTGTPTPTGTRITHTFTPSPTLCANNYLNWTTLATMPTTRQMMSAAAVNGILYVAGGLHNYNTLNTLEAYNPATNSWSTLAPMPTARKFLAAGSVNGILYEVGGYNGNYLNTVEAYNPATNSWSTMAPMPTAREQLSVAVVNGILYAIGGFNNSGLVANVEAYNPATNSWSELAAIPTQRYALTVGVVNGIIYAAGGSDINGNTQGALEAYNPVTNSWTTGLPAMPTGIYSGVGGVMNGQFYVADGTSTANTNLVQSYNPLTNSWSIQTSAPTVRTYAAADVINGTLYIEGGFIGLGPLSNVAVNEAGALECGSSPTPTNTPTITNSPTLTLTPTGTVVIPTATFTTTTCPSSYLTWSSMAPLPTARFGLSSGIVNGILYALGGIGSNGYLGTVEGYNPATNSWATGLSSMPTARSYLAAGVVNGIIYAVGGYNATGALSTVEAYNPATNRWSTMAPMPTAREDLSVGVVNGILYAVGGYDSNGVLNTVETYNPATNSWSEMATMPTARAVLAVGVVNGILYAAGGGGASGVLSTLEAYNPSTNSWSTGFPAMSTPRTNPACGVMNGQFYVADGSSSDAYLNTVEAYNPLTNSWTPQTSAMTARDSLAGGIINGTFYMVGGGNYKGGYLSTNEAGALDCGFSPTPTGTLTTSTPTPVLTATPTYCPSNYLNWAVKTPMPVARFGMGAAVLNGYLYTVGGENNNGTLNTVEWYNPAANNWIDVQSVPTTRYRLAAGVVNGILYAVGGQNGTTYNTVEAYNQATNSWSTKATMPTARAGLGVAVINGILYAVGGEYIGGSLNNLEAYNPATNSWTVLAPMPTGSAGMAVGVLNGMLYVAGGISTTGQGYTPLSTLQAYNPATNTWTTGLPGMPTARGFCSGGVMNGQLYVAGGETNLGFTGVLGTVESYSPTTNIWSTQTSLPTAVNGSAAGVINGNLFVVGGSDINNNPLAINQDGDLICGFTPTSTFTQTSTFTVTPSPTPIQTATPTLSHTPTSGNIDILSISPACASIGGSVTIVWSWNGNTANGNVDYVVGFAPNGTQTCSGVVWANPYTCNGGANGVLNPTNAGSTSSGTVTTVVTVPSGAPSGDILLGYALSCGTVQFTAANSNCGGNNYWTASAFSICAVGTSTPTVMITPTSTYTSTPANSATSTSTNTMTYSPTASLTPTVTRTNTNTYTFTPALTATSTNSATSTLSLTVTPTLTPTNSPTATGTPIHTATNTFTSTVTATATNTAVPPTATFTKTFTPILPTSTPTVTPTSASGCSGVAVWNGNFVAYSVGNKVTYNNELYQCIEAHTSEPNWEPPVVPALWKDMGPCAGGGGGELAAFAEDSKITPTLSLTVTSTPMLTASTLLQSAVAGPNVSKNYQPVRFFVKLNQPAQVNVAIYTPMGQLVASSSFFGNTGANSWLWDIQNASKELVASGLYIYTIHVSSNGIVETKTGKIVIMH